MSLLKRIRAALVGNGEGLNPSTDVYLVYGTTQKPGETPDFIYVDCIGSAVKLLRIEQMLNDADLGNFSRNHGTLSFLNEE